MLKGSHIVALALALTSLIVGISTEIANAEQSIGRRIDNSVGGLDALGDSKDTAERRCTKKCPVIHSGGNTDDSPANDPTSTTDLKLNQGLETAPTVKLEVKPVDK